ncbi:hypothetical protein [Streptosporangium amethystogenes]|uniref:hypothetical protein n=1 Tax=Streptosporangium amethystogenes TaxID=2002 RepID=UPI0004C84C8D|nr:hypothetical protein [Streptosporangium amethystogenes]
MSVTDLELAGELRELADHPHLAARQDQLRDLADAVTDPDMAGHWCEIDLFAAFSPDDTILVDGEPAESTSSPRRPGWRRGLSGAIGPALVFVPIFITWLGLMMATGAYGDVLAAGGLNAARRPFLEMWQQGFDGRLPGVFEFDNIALCTLAAIFCLICWTVFENITRNTREDAAERELRALRVRLRGALTEASLVLGQVRLSAPERFGAELNRAAADIGFVGTTARKVHTELVEALTLTLEATRKTTDALAGSAIDVRDAVEHLGGHLAAVNSTCDDLAAAVARFSAVIDTAGSTAGQAVTDVGNQLSTTISRTTLDMRQAFNDELVRSVSSVQGSVSGLDLRINELVGATAGISHAVDRAAISIDSVGSSAEKAVSLLGARVTDTIAGTAREFHRTFEGAGTEIREALESWSAATGTHASRIDTTIETVALLERTREALDRLPTALASALADLPSRELAERETTGSEQAGTRLRLPADGLWALPAGGPGKNGKNGENGEGGGNGEGPNGGGDSGDVRADGGDNETDGSGDDDPDSRQRTRTPL